MLGAIDQVVNDFACALALVDHAGNLSTQKRTLFVVAVLGGLTQRTGSHSTELLGTRAGTLALGIGVGEGALEGAHWMSRRATGRTR